MSKPKLYTVIPVNYEYNDETYYQEGLGSPVRTFTDSKAAEDVAKKLTLNELRGDNLGKFTYSLEEIFKDDYADGVAKLKAVGLNPPEDPSEAYGEFYLPADLTLKQLNVILSLINLEFYVVHELQVE